MFSQHMCQLPQALSPCGPLTVGLYALDPLSPREAKPGSCQLCPRVSGGHGWECAACSTLAMVQTLGMSLLPSQRMFPSRSRIKKAHVHVAAQSLGSDMQGSNPSLTACFGKPPPPRPWLSHLENGAVERTCTQVC